MEEERVNERIAGFEEKQEPFFGFLKKVNTLHIIIFSILICGILYFIGKNSGKDYTTIIGVIIAFTFLIIVLSGKSEERKILDLNLAADILYKIINNILKIPGQTEFPDGTLTVTRKGYLRPSMEFSIYYINFYIDTEDMRFEYKGKVRDDGVYVGYEVVRGDTSGKPPREDVEQPYYYKK